MKKNEKKLGSLINEKLLKLDKKTKKKTDYLLLYKDEKSPKLS